MTHIVNTLQSSKQIIFVDTKLSSLLQIARKYVEECLRIGVSIDVPMGFFIQICPENGSVDEIPILHII